jgi:hypothetical protein
MAPYDPQKHHRRSIRLKGYDYTQPGAEVIGVIYCRIQSNRYQPARRELHIEGVWQRNYYEHILRNEREFTNIWNYIDTNPLRWRVDQLRPAAPANRKKQG